MEAGDLEVKGAVSHSSALSHLHSPHNELSVLR